MEQVGIADVEEDGVPQAPRPGLAIHDVADPATDKHVVIHRERLCVVAVQL